MHNDSTGVAPAGAHSPETDQSPNGPDGYTTRDIPIPPPPPYTEPQQEIRPYRPQSPPASVSTTRFIVGAAIVFVALLLAAVGLAVGGEPSRFMAVGLEFIPF